MSRMDLSTNRFLTDDRQISFIISSGEQDYELAMSAIQAGDSLTFYTIFKPVGYDHIVYMSSFTPSWINAKALFKEILDQVVGSYSISIDDYPEIVSFIS